MFHLDYGPLIYGDHCSKSLSSNIRHLHILFSFFCPRKICETSQTPRPDRENPWRLCSIPSRIVTGGNKDLGMRWRGSRHGLPISPLTQTLACQPSSSLNSFSYYYTFGVSMYYVIFILLASIDVVWTKNRRMMDDRWIHVRWAEWMRERKKKSHPNAIRFSMGDIRSGLFSLSYDYRSKQTNKQEKKKKRSVIYTNAAQWFFQKERERKEGQDHPARGLLFMSRMTYSMVSLT